MKIDLLDRVVQPYLKKEVPDFRVGDTVRVLQKVTEGARTRSQIFEGVMIRKRGRGMSFSFTVRRVSFGEGVEKTFPFHSETVQSVEVVRRGKVRRAKLYYLRKKLGKQVRIEEADLEKSDAPAV